MVSFEIFVKAMPPSLSELKVLPSFCFAFKIPDDVVASNIYEEKVLTEHFSSNRTFGMKGAEYFIQILHVQYQYLHVGREGIRGHPLLSKEFILIEEFKIL